MARFKDGSYGSQTGIALIAKVLAGRCKMKYTKASVGSGEIPENETPKTMSGPAGFVMDASITAITNPIDGECQVTIQIKSEDVEQGFYATNIVLYAEDPDEGEVPYTYLLLENEPEWVRPASSIVGKIATFDIIAAVGDVDVVIANINPESLATVGQVEQIIERHNTALNTHENLGSAKIFRITIPTNSWTAESGIFKADITLSEATDEMYPSITIDKENLNTAYAAGMYQTVRSNNGKLHFWSTLRPTSNINATAALFLKKGAES